MTKKLYIDLDGPLRGLVLKCVHWLTLGDGGMTPATLDLEELKASLEHYIAGFPGYDEYVLCLSSLDSRYWRHDIMPSYKATRKDSLDQLVWLSGRYGLVRDLQADQWLPPKARVWVVDNLEADDLVAIGMTEGYTGLSNDKDLLTVPGRLLFRGERTIVTEESALRSFLTQVLVGDSCDGIPGCPGVGPKGAEKILAAESPEGMWAGILAAYQKAGLGRDDAVRTAQVLRMKQTSDEPLWEPSMNGLEGETL